MFKMRDKLALYEELEEQQLLLILPCKVGKTIYRPVPKLYRTYTQSIITEISITKNGIFIITDKGLRWNIEEIGKTIFLTQKEAEQKLKEIKGE